MKLTLRPESGRHPSVSSELTRDKRKLSLARLFKDGSDQYIFAAEQYILRLEDWDEEPPKHLRITVSGEQVKATALDDGSYRLDKLISFYGMIRFELSFRHGEIWYKLYSGFFPVVLPQNKENGNVTRMIRLVASRQKHWLLHDVMADGTSDTQQQISPTMQAQLDMLSKGAALYTAMPLGLQGHISSELQMTEMSKVLGMPPEALHYIASHPDDLMPCQGGGALVRSGVGWIPRRVLQRQIYVEMNTRQNRIAFSFLVNLSRKAWELSQRLDGWNRQTDVSARSSADRLRQSLSEPLRQQLLQAEESEAVLQRQMSLWRQLLPQVPPMPLTSVPVFTPEDLREPMFAALIQLIRAWFSQGEVEAAADLNDLLSLLVDHRLYEYYVLLRLLGGIQDQGWTFRPRDSLCFRYPAAGNEAAQVDHMNTFLFEQDDRQLTLWFQPVIYSGLSPNAGSNGLGLVRNTHLNGDTEHAGNEPWLPQGQPCFTPDLVLGLRDGSGASRYIVCDAKYKNRYNVWRYDIPKLAFNYLFALSALGGDEQLGVALIFGRDDGDSPVCDSARSLYPGAAGPDLRLFPMSERADRDRDEGIRLLLSWLTWDQ